MQNSMQRIQQLASFLYKKTFHKKLKIEIYENKRLKKTIAWFIPVDKYDESRIEIASFCKNANDYVLTDILLHELTHYHLYRIGKPYDDLDKEFINEINRNGASPTNTMTSNKDPLFSYYEYVANCTKCNKRSKILTRSKIESDIPLYICPQCSKIYSYHYVDERMEKYIPNEKIKALVQEWHEIENVVSIKENKSQNNAITSRANKHVATTVYNRKL